ncbi:uroporphyrinogen-III synthase [Leucobacter soli]|uniref:uroporphyrinogen-III synthase n=1 Tax=Leucobacter soli TaxID=2812850 RepID=UPI00361953A8
MLLPLSESADDTLETALRAAGHRPERVGAYRTVAAPRDPAVEAEVAAGRIDALLVLSGSAAHEVSERFAPIPPRTRLAAIGGPTARALASHGLRAAVVSAVHTVPGLLDALGEALSAPTEGAHA